MSRTPRKTWLATLTVVLLFVIAFPAAIFATHAWSNYHWARTSNPFTLKTGDNLTSTDWKGHLSATVQDWNAGSPKIVNSVIVAGTSRKRCSAVAGTSQVCNGTYGNNGWLGLASINISGSHITQGTAKMNDTYFNTATYNNPNERRHVMCQEVAHVFGLGHQSEDGSSLNTCMDYFSNTGANATSTLSTKPNQHDFDMLAQIYQHLDSTTTLASSTSSKASGREVSDDPNSWGQLVSQSANGRSSTYEVDHGGGNKTITHVFWTNEAAARCPGCDHRFDH